MKKILILLSLLLLQTGCTLFHVHRMDIEQGNVITDDMVRRVHPGMTKGEVVEIMGTPVLINTFRDSRSDYVYTFHKANGPTNERYLTLEFKGNVLKSIEGNRYSEYMK